MMSIRGGLVVAAVGASAAMRMSAAFTGATGGYLVAYPSRSNLWSNGAGVRSSDLTKPSHRLGQSDVLQAGENLRRSAMRPCEP